MVRVRGRSWSGPHAQHPVERREKRKKREEQGIPDAIITGSTLTEELLRRGLPHLASRSWAEALVEIGDFELEYDC